MIFLLFFFCLPALIQRVPLTHLNPTRKHFSPYIFLNSLCGFVRRHWAIMGTLQIRIHTIIWVLEHVGTCRMNLKFKPHWGRQLLRHWRSSVSFVSLVIHWPQHCYFCQAGRVLTCVCLLGGWFLTWWWCWNKKSEDQVCISCLVWWADIGLSQICQCRCICCAENIARGDLW